MTMTPFGYVLTINGQDIHMRYATATAAPLEAVSSPKFTSPISRKEPLIEFLALGLGLISLGYLVPYTIRTLFSIFKDTTL